MEIIMNDGTVVDNVSVCDINSINYALTIVVDGVGIERMVTLTSLFGDKERTFTLKKRTSTGIETAFAGYTHLTSVRFDAIDKTLTLFLADI